MLFYTICTLSHIYQAEIMVNSLRRHHPGAVIKIGLVDKLPAGFDPGPLGDTEIVEVAALGIPDFEDMYRRYQIYELCFACKPYYALYFFEKYRDVDKIVYLDTDIFVFSSFAGIEEKLEEYALIITPHITDPVQDGHKLERHVLHAGLFNAGFFGVSRKPAAFKFLEWFADKLKTQCIGGVGDQVWLSLAPVFFDKVLVEKGPGYNMAGWNVMHRFIEISGDRVIVNGTDLVFYHYSGFDYQHPETISRFTNQGAEMSRRQDVVPVLKLISEKLIASNYTGLKNRKSIYFNYASSKRSLRKTLSALRKRIRG